MTTVNPAAIPATGPAAGWHRHRRLRGALAVAVGIPALALLAPQAAQAATCESLVGQKFGQATVYEASDIKTPLRVANLSRREGVLLSKPLCRIKGLIEPVKGSSIQFEVWLPEKTAWNGRFAGVGNGAFSGSIAFDQMERPFTRGYAVASTDAGHVSGGQESFWALGQPERVIDWAWRAHHLTAVAAKQIVAAFYGNAAAHSYFFGCSKGGTSALMEAQRFPDDYDGIVTGAPGWNQSGQITSYTWTQQAIAAPGGWISPAKLETLHRAVFKACKNENGFLIDPASCTYDPGKLLCTRGDADSCLTAPQIDTVRKIYSGPTDPAGKVLYPGLARGSELTWSRFLMGPEDRKVTGAWIYPNMLGYMGDVLYGRTNIDFRALDMMDVWNRSVKELGATVDAVNHDLTPFEARGGKLIHYQGWNDPIVRPAASVQLFENTAAKMGGTERTQSFYRLFMGPGMDHCAGGIGPSMIGVNGPAPSQSPEYDMIAAIERWVEQKQAPDRIVATLYHENNPAKGVAAQRPWCPHPAIAAYTGRGDRAQASSYACTLPRRPRT